MLFYSTLNERTAMRLGDYYYAQLLMTQGDDPDCVDGELVERIIDLLSDFGSRYDASVDHVEQDFDVARGFEEYSAELEYEAEFEHFGAQTPYL